MRTFQLLFAGEEVVASEDGGCQGDETREYKVAGVDERIFGGGKGSVVVTEDIREWDYGEYEGIKPEDVRDMRSRKGLDVDGKKWSVWRDGCPGGEWVLEIIYVTGFDANIVFFADPRKMWSRGWTD